MTAALPDVALPEYERPPRSFVRYPALVWQMFCDALTAADLDAAADLIRTYPHFLHETPEASRTLPRFNFPKREAAFNWLIQQGAKPQPGDFARAAQTGSFENMKRLVRYFEEETSPDDPGHGSLFDRHRLIRTALRFALNDNHLAEAHWILTQAPDILHWVDEGHRTLMEVQESKLQQAKNQCIQSGHPGRITATVQKEQAAMDLLRAWDAQRCAQRALDDLNPRPLAEKTLDAPAAGPSSVRPS